MWFKSIKASRLNAKGLTVVVLVAFLVTNMVFGEIMSKGADRSHAMKLSGASHISRFNKRHLMTSTNVMMSGHDFRLNVVMPWLRKRKEQIKQASQSFKKNKAAFSSKSINLVALLEWHKDLLKTYSSEIAEDMVLDKMFLHFRTDEGVAWELLKVEGYAGHAGIKELCSSLSNRLFVRWIGDDVTPQSALKRLGLKGSNLDKLFGKPLIATWEQFVKKFLSVKMFMKIDSSDVEYTILRCLSAEHGVPNLAKALLVRRFPTANNFAKRMYKTQLYTWSKTNPEEVLKLLGISKEKPFSDSVRLSVWLDYVLVYNIRVESDFLDKESILKHFAEAFNNKYSLLDEKTEKWESCLIDWQIRLQKGSTSDLIVYAKTLM